MIETLQQRVNNDQGLVRRGRYLTTSFLLEVGHTPWLVSIFEGRPLLYHDRLYRRLEQEEA